MFSYTAPNPYPSTSWFTCCTPPEKKSNVGTLPIWPGVYVKKFDRELLSSRYRVEVNAGMVITHDGAVLDTLELKPVSFAPVTIEKQHFIIKFAGNDGIFEDQLNTYADDARRLQKTVIGFNYRGVSNSIAPFKDNIGIQDLVFDGIAEVNRLLAAGVIGNHILLDGHSLGAAIATLVAYHFHQKRIPVYLWNDRSSAIVSDKNASTLAMNMPSLFKQPNDKWNAIVSRAYEAIPAEYKAYMVIAKKSVKSGGDEIINHETSLHSAIRHEEKKNNALTGYKVTSPIDRPGHLLPRAHLMSKQNPTHNGQRLYHEFVTRKMAR